ncbi:hypothetical protein HanPSC8_Chr17g0754941 [Helianthus annuus]|nr:hypothetical protein HanPSC8_Chr17g0754941 [Helianthus annuus]
MMDDVMFERRKKESPKCINCFLNSPLPLSMVVCETCTVLLLSLSLLSLSRIKIREE